MIGRASTLITQINDMVNELQNIKNPELDAKKKQINVVAETIQKLETSGVRVPTELVIIQNQLKSEFNEFDPPEEILAYIRDQLKLTISKIDRIGTINLEKSEMKKSHKIKICSDHHESLTENEWMAISEAEKTQYKMEYDRGTIILTDIFGERHKCKTINTLKRHERGEGHKREET